MLVVFGLDARVGRKQIAAGLTRAARGPRLLVELGLSGSTWSHAGAPLTKRTPTLDRIYAGLGSRQDGARRVRVPLETVVGSVSDLASGRPLVPSDLARRELTPVVRAPLEAAQAAERALELGPALVSLAVQLEQSEALGPMTVVVDAGWVVPGLIGQAVWAASARDLVLVASERAVAVASLSYFERAFPQARLWVLAIAPQRRRRAHLVEVVRFVLRARSSVEVIALDPALLGRAPSKAGPLQRAFDLMLAGSSRPLVELAR